MNIWTQCCGMVLLVVLFFFYRQQKLVHLSTEKAFWRSFCLTIVAITLDILSLIAIDNMDILPMWLVVFICKTYLVSLLSVVLCSLLYICVDIYMKDRLYLKYTKRYIAIACVGAVMIYLLPIHIYSDAQTSVMYTYGPSDNIAYAFALFLLAINLYTMIRQKDRVNPRRREAVFVWMAVWLCAAAIQLLDKSILIVGYAGAVGMVVLYLKLENPEMNLDRRTGLFNQNAFFEYTRELFEKKQECAILCLYFEEKFQQNLQMIMEEEAGMEVCQYLLNIPEVLVFKNSEDEIVLVTTDVIHVEERIEKLWKRFDEGFGKDGSVFIRPYGIYIPHSNMVSDVKDIFPLLNYVRNNSKEYSENYYITVDESMVLDMHRERETERLILNAIEHERIEVFYQPIFSTKEKQFTCAEALVRIRDEQGKLVPPGQFIDVAEKNGTIIKLGEIVFEKVCQFIKENGLTRYGIKYIEVNLSVVQCAYMNLAADFIRIMEKYGVSPRFINLEITESASLPAKGILLDNMKCLMNYGVRFSLDDFGTGQSNLNYIVDMPVGIVKFDRDMTNAYFENGKAKYVMDAAMHMIHGMNLEIVSEGIETKKQYETMEQLGISYIQGFYFAKPLPEKEFLEFLQKEYAME